MSPEERYKITSSDYADLIIEGNNRINEIAGNPEYSVLALEDNYAVAYLPSEYMDFNSVRIFGYDAIPKIYGLLSYVSLESSGITQLRGEPGFDLEGEGVLIGFIDTGIDYISQAFRNADQSTRIVSIWDQTLDTGAYPENFYYGTEFNQEQINSALQNRNPLSVVPTNDENGHGTMLAGVAAGTVMEENGFAGVAPKSELVVVKLKQAKPYLKEFFRVPQNSVSFQSNDILMGVSYLNQLSARLNRPLVICLGVGTNQGDHEGRCLLCRYLQDISNMVGHSVVIAAGNEGNRGHHFFGEINPSKEQEVISLYVGENETGFSVELWGYAPNIVEVDIYSPEFSFVVRIPESLGPQETIEVVYENTTILVDSQNSEASTGDQLILMRFQNPKSGIWRFVVSGTTDLAARYHLWLPMDGFITGNTYFFNSDSQTTISAPGNTVNTLTVTAYNPINESLYYNASRGFTKDNEFKPDVAAPGVNIKAPVSENAFTRATGTSIAAAHAAGVAAMLLEWGIVRGNLPVMSNVIIRRMLISGARRFSNTPYPNQDWGFGILDINRTFMLFRDEGLV
jgi:subtilisin family serine protease